MEKLPAPLREVVQRFASLPGIGPKSALRIGLELLRCPGEQARDFGRAIFELRDNLCMCEHCLALAETSPCPICADGSRNPEQLCLVPEWDGLLTMEETGLYKGLYMVLGGLISPLDGMESNCLDFDQLRKRLAKGVVRELILALGATLEAETTTSHVKNMVEAEFPQVELTRLAQGIPMGGQVKYMDCETLRQSLVYRQKI